ncbi:restriction endonuclease subunit S [Synechococcus sp. PCC 7336]|uniref:restriction endonuclease subunit S n=1 Tax=Synechococcus sp. PCC 7336 TaxID=195250 RepID=UPI00034B527B|nr:restriction endonuclease subunit S [Synechococcus sp. PCC 7336]
MSSEWLETTLGEVVELKRGYDLPRRNRKDGTIPIVSSSGISDTHNEAKVSGPGVVTGRYGTLGQVYWIEGDYWPLNTTLYVKDFKGNDPRYISYLLETIDYLSYSDKAAVPGVNRNHLHLAKVKIPRYEEQKLIAHILNTLDEKIELNRQMNQTLEAIAQAIFKSWFVDFEPVKAKQKAREAGGSAEDIERAGMAAICGKATTKLDFLANEIQESLNSATKLFPDELTSSEFGIIPLGWNSGCLIDFAKLTMGQSPKSEFYNTEGQGLPFHQGVKNFGSRFPTHNVFCTVENRIAERGDILFSVRAPVGRINVADRKMVIGRGLAAIRHKDNKQSFLNYFLKHSFQEEDIIGSGTIYNSVTKKEMQTLSVLSPSSLVLEYFEKIAVPIDILIAKNDNQIRILSELIYTLLPKLLSGEINFSGAGKQLQKVVQ